jgi:DNA-directed RNA polymerase specialized sigma24 family protein
VRKATSAGIVSGRRPAAQLPLWPERLRSLAVGLTRPASPEERERRISELWPLLYGSLSRFVRLHASRYGSIDPDLTHDIASEKAIDLLSRIDKRTWNPGRWSPGQLAGLLSRIARNGVVDHVRSRLRVRDVDPLPCLERRAARAPVETAEHGLERRLFAVALRDCAGTLQRRARAVWLLRVFLELPSAEIARHPGVRMRAPAVDMMLMRCRRIIRRCMRRKGFEPGDMPPGAFPVLWKAFGFDAQPEREE